VESTKNVIELALKRLDRKRNPKGIYKSTCEPPFSKITHSQQTSEKTRERQMEETIKRRKEKRQILPAFERVFSRFLRFLILFNQTFREM